MEIKDQIQKIQVLKNVFLVINKFIRFEMRRLNSACLWGVTEY